MDPRPPSGRRTSPPPGAGRVVPLAGLLEGGMALAAVLIGGFIGFQPANRIHYAWSGVLWGLLATLPMVLFLVVSVAVPWRPFRRMKVMIDRVIAPMFRGQPTLSLLLIAILAGLGEELFFRGLLQAGLAHAIGGTTGLVVSLVAASLLFGLVHPVTVGYAVTAALMGVYFGALLILFDDLLVPITAHAAYDFVALYYYVRLRRRGRPS